MKIPCIKHKRMERFIVDQELRLVEAGKAIGITTRIRVKADVCRIFPHRSLVSIKGIR